MANAIIIRQKQISRRAFVTATLCFSGVMATGCLAKPQATRPKILFVCQAGTAKERGIDVDVFSRGIVVEDHISPELRKKLIADGINTNAEAATSLKPADWATAEILVNFNPLPASVKHKDVRDWTDVPSVNDDYAKARALMNERIDALLSDIAGSAK
jgi:hypothetical protein